MTRPSEGSGEAGFTLVEALVSLFVFSLVAAGCVAMLMQSVDTERRIGLSHEALREVQAVRTLLAADLAQYTPRETRGAEGRIRPRFVGGDEAGELAFVRATASPDPELGFDSAMALVTYRFDDAGRLLRSAVSPLERSGVDLEASVVLAGAGEGAHFEFFDGAEWRLQWISAAQGAPPPRAVALVWRSDRYGPMRIEALVGLGS